MKLGEMLVRDGRITPAQLDQALAHQTRVGGRIGSILVELGFMDAETLTVYLGLELGIPIATGATLERCKRSAVRLLTPQQAARSRFPAARPARGAAVPLSDRPCCRNRRGRVPRSPRAAFFLK